MPKVYTELQKKQWFHEYQSGKSVKKFVLRMESHETRYMEGLNYLIRQSQRREQKFQGLRLVSLEQQNKHLQEMFDFGLHLRTLRKRYGISQE